MFNADSRAVAAVIAGMTRENRVSDWPEDEREFYRSGDWNSFADREERLQLMRARKVLAVLRDLEPEPPSRPREADERLILVDVPAVPFGPDGDPDEADARYYREAARNIRFQAQNGDAFAGSNLTEIVAVLCDNAAEALELTRRRRERGSFFPYSLDECPRREEHRDPAGPNEDVSVCKLCGKGTWTMRPDGESYGWHLPDCSLPLRHQGWCRPGGDGHVIPEGWAIRG